jgi:hypothetical protein
MKVVASGIDKAARGSGYVEKELNQDDQLKRCIALEFSSVTSLIGNRGRIGLLFVTDVVRGLKNKALSQ